MSSAKQYNLPPSIVIPTTAITNQNVTSSVTNIFNKDNIGYQFVWTGTVAGTFAVQVSIDYNPVTGVGTWDALPLNPTPTASGSPGSWFVDITETSAPFIRAVFTYTSGSGNLTGSIVGKGI